jgi:hypothetical protein
VVGGETDVDFLSPSNRLMQNAIALELRASLLGPRASRPHLSDELQFVDFNDKLKLVGHLFASRSLRAGRSRSQ